MAFTVSDIQSFTRILASHPEWRAEVRRAVLTDDLLALPAIMRDLGQAQRELTTAQARTEKRLEELAAAEARTDARLAELAAAQARTEKHLEELAAAEARTDARLAELAAAQARTEACVAELAQAQKRSEALLATLNRRQDEMLGDILEARYARRAFSYFGRWLRRIRVALPGELASVMEQTLESRLSPDELHDLLQIDLLISGRPRAAEMGSDGEIWLAIEVSAVVDQGDVTRARQRAALLGKAGYRAIAAVAGQSLTEGAAALLQGTPTVQILDGRSQGWEEAFAALGHHN